MRPFTDLPDDLTMQQLLDLNIQHFIRNGGEYSIDPKTDNCLYRLKPNVGCAIGIAMTDDDVDQLPISERFASVGSLEADGLLPNRFNSILDSDDGYKFLDEIQFAHDTAAKENDPDQRRKDHLDGLRHVARRYDLEFPEDL